MKKNKITIGLLLTLIMLIIGCTETKDVKTKSKLQIVCTTGMIADALKNIVGEKADVQALMGPGVDPHLYKVTQGDLQKLQHADIVFYNGLHLEGKMSEVLEKLGAKKKVIAFSDGIEKAKIRMLDETGTVRDPHIWFNVAIWKEAVLYASKELQKLDSTNQKLYNLNTINFANDLTTLNVWVKIALDSIPKQSRLLITAHDAFGYFGAAYGIEVKGLQGISTVSDYGLNDVTSLVNLITARKIKAIFIESSVSDKSIKAVVEGCQAKGHKVVIGGTLYSDAMGQDGTPDGTYIGMVKANVTKIVSALK